MFLSIFERREPIRKKLKPAAAAPAAAKEGRLRSDDSGDGSDGQEDDVEYDYNSDSDSSEWEEGGRDWPKVSVGFLVCLVLFCSYVCLSASARRSHA